ncbi:hypothetical protein AB0L34_03590 [Micromonospora sp. NPDC052213]|uniref:hypothetical protein n=1 Tax=Micromonospora sp. NPDC052213 TaxID=3155812 RepID=UPI00344173D2
MLAEHVGEPVGVTGVQALDEDLVLGQDLVAPGQEPVALAEQQEPLPVGQLVVEFARH